MLCDVKPIGQTNQTGLSVAPRSRSPSLKAWHLSWLSEVETQISEFRIGEIQNSLYLTVPGIILHKL
jgi:hypothetical protein